MFSTHLRYKHYLWVRMLILENFNFTTLGLTVEIYLVLHIVQFICTKQARYITLL